MLEALVFHPFWCLGAQRKGMVIAMNIRKNIDYSAMFASTNYNGEAVRRIRQKEGGSAMNFPTALLAAAVAVVFISIVVSGVRRRKRGGGCSGGCGCSGCAGTCHLEK